MTARLLCRIAVVIALLSPGATMAHAQTVEDLYRQGVEARHSGLFDEAAGLFERALALDPDNADVLVQLGFAQLGNGDEDAALRSFESVLSIAPDYSDAAYGLALIAYREGRLADARALLEPLVAAAPEREDFASLLASIEKAEAAEAEAAAKKAEAAEKAQAAERAKAAKEADAAARRKAKARSPERRPPRLEPALADPLALLMADGRRLRLAGSFIEAEATYHRALALSPNNHDALVELGLINGFQQDYDEAEAFFESALAIAPGSIDARLGLVRVSIWRGRADLARQGIDAVLADTPETSEAMLLEARVALLERDHARAEAAFAAVLRAEPENVEALVGLGDMRRLRYDEEGAQEAYGRALTLSPDAPDILRRIDAPAPRRWRLDFATEYSDLSNGQDDWTDSVLALSWRWSPQTTVSGLSRLARRYGESDLQFEGRINHAFSSDFSAYGLLAATPDAFFLAQYSVGGGLSVRAEKDQRGNGPMYVNIDARYDVYDDSNVWTLSPWVQLYLFEERLALTARWIHSEDNLGAKADGYLVRVDLNATDQFRIFAGYADAPEVSIGVLVDTRTIFGGLSLDLTPGLTINASYAREERTTFDRETVGLGIAVRF